MAATRQSGTVRERLLQSADALFYREGIHVVGIDRILAESGVAKASLYGTFKSKDELVRAYLEDRFKALSERIGARVAQAGGGRAGILAVFDDFVDRVTAGPAYRGCPFIRACAEGGDEPGSAQEVSAAFRRWRRELFQRLAEEDGLPSAPTVGQQLSVIYDGAAVAVAMDHDPGAASAVREMVEQWLGTLHTARPSSAPVRSPSPRRVTQRTPAKKR